MGQIHHDESGTLDFASLSTQEEDLINHSEAPADFFHGGCEEAVTAWELIAAFATS